MYKKTIKSQKITNILSRKIENIYKKQLEHKLDNISYKIFDRTLIILLEGTITSSEKLLKRNDRDELAKQVREAIDEIIQPQIKELIEEVLNVKVIDFLCDTTIERDLTGAIAIFEFLPQQIRDSH